MYLGDIETAPDQTTKEKAHAFNLKQIPHQTEARIIRILTSGSSKPGFRRYQSTDST
jgi:hypothetical protein